MITSPIPFEEAISHLLDKTQLPAEWNSADWIKEGNDIKTRAFFSARVENARFLDRSQGLIFDYLAKVRDDVVSPDGVTRSALRVSGRAQFVKLMRDFQVQEGMAAEEDFASVNQKDITDIRSRTRLDLIFDTHVRQAYGYGQWKQGMTPAVLEAFPYGRLIRDMSVKEPRPRHEANLGQVRHKQDLWWEDYINGDDIGGFGVPWGPYGYNSGCTQEDAAEEDAQDVGKIAQDGKMGMKGIVRNDSPTPGLNTGLSAGTKRMDPEIKRKLLEELRNGPKAPDMVAAARKAAANARRQAFQRGVDKAVERGDVAAEEKYRQAIGMLDQMSGMIIRDDGDKIALEKTE